MLLKPTEGKEVRAVVIDKGVYGELERQVVNEAKNINLELSSAGSDYRIAVYKGHSVIDVLDYFAGMDNVQGFVFASHGLEDAQGNFLNKVNFMDHGNVSPRFVERTLGSGLSNWPSGLDGNGTVITRNIPGLSGRLNLVYCKGANAQENVTHIRRALGSY